MSEVAAAAGRELAATAAVPEARLGVATEQQRARGLETPSAKERRGDGGRSTAASTGKVSIGKTGGATRYGPRQHPDWAPKTPAVGRPGNTRATKDAWRASSSDGSVGVDSPSFTCGVAAGTAVWVEAKSAAAREHHGTAAEASRVVAGSTDTSNHSTSLAKRPGGTLSNLSATTYDASCSLSPHLTKKYSEQRKTIQERHGGCKRDAISGSSVQWAAVGSSEAPWNVDGSTESLWGSPGLLPEDSPKILGVPGSSEALYVLPTQASKPGGRWGSPGSPEGAWAAASAAAAVALAAEARKEAARGMSPSESNASGRRYFHGDGGAGGVEHGPDNGEARKFALRPSFSSSGSSIESAVGGSSRGGVGGGSIEANTCNQTVFGQAAPRSTMVVASSGRQTPLSRRSLSPSLSKSMPHQHSSSSGTQSPSSLRHGSAAPGASWRQLPRPLSSPHTFRGVPLLAEALAHGQPDATPSLPTTSAALPARLQLESSRPVRALAAPADGAIIEMATSHSSWIKDLRCSAARGVEERASIGENMDGVGILASGVARQHQQQHQEGNGLQDGDPGLGEADFNGKAVLRHDHAVAPSNMATASVTSVACDQQHSHRGPPLCPSPDSISVLDPATDEEAGLTTGENSVPSVAGIDRARGLNDDGGT